jgi:hypothetical protein
MIRPLDGVFNSLTLFCLFFFIIFFITQSESYINGCINVWQFKQWWWKKHTNINKMNNYLSPQIIDYKKDHNIYPLEIIIQALDRHTNVAA